MVGKDLLIAVGGVIVAAQRSCTLNMDVDTIEVCSPVDGAWKKHIPTTIGWQVQCAGLIYNPEHADALIDAISKREMVRISFYDPELRMLRSGYAIMTTLEEGGSIGDMASQSMQFLGSGELEKVEAKTQAGWKATGTLLNGSVIANGEDHKFIDVPSAGSMYQICCGVLTLPSESSVTISVSPDGTEERYAGAILADGGHTDVAAAVTEAMTDGMIKWYKQWEEMCVDEWHGKTRSIVLPKGSYTIVYDKSFADKIEVTAVSIPVN